MEAAMVEMVASGPRERLRAFVDHNVGVTAREAYEVKRVDRDYFGDDV